MAVIRYVFVMLVLSFISVRCAPLTGKALFCRDPDTGKLYSINATWISSTFCGNYTCRIRKHNITRSEPIRQINITNIPDRKKMQSVVTITHKTEPDMNSLIYKTGIPHNMVESKLASKNLNVRKHDTIKIKNPENSFEQISKITNSLDGEDRYLTEEEIHHIADVLHTVKKSDLDAIVEIYNIAREITKEIDKASDKELVEEAIKLIKEEDFHHNNGHKHPSYWYDPLANKGRVVEKYDMVQQNTNTMPSVAKSQEKVQSYFSGVFASNDIGKLPYYYPVTSFQRLSSYAYPAYYPTRRPIIDYTKGITERPCTKHQNKPRKQERENLIQTSRLLPYPFTNIHGLNISDYHTKSKTYYNNNAWVMDYYKRHKNNEPNLEKYISHLPKAILLNPYLSEVQDIEQPALLDSQSPKQEGRQKKKSLLGDIYSKKNKRPDWKTEQIALDVLDDIRAHIDTSRIIKAYPWRKKTKLEKVGKVVNIDKLEVITDRRRRSLNVTNIANINGKHVLEVINVNKEEINTSDYSGEYEAFLDIVTCETQTEPGFFRMGNMSQPYPACCPQLVNKTR